MHWYTSVKLDVQNDLNTFTLMHMCNSQEAYNDFYTALSKRKGTKNLPRQLTT